LAHTCCTATSRSRTSSANHPEFNETLRAQDMSARLHGRARERLTFFAGRSEKPGARLWTERRGAVAHAARMAATPTTQYRQYRQYPSPLSRS
jgi:hypothetical protein